MPLEKGEEGTVLSWLSSSSLPLRARRDPSGPLGANVTLNFLFTCAAPPVTACFVPVPAVAPGAVPGDGTFVLAIHLLAPGEQLCQWEQSKMLPNIRVIPKSQTLETSKYI